MLSIILILQFLIGSDECYLTAILRILGPIRTCKRISGRKITLPKLECGQMAGSFLGIFDNIKIHLYMNCRAHTSFINSPWDTMSWNSWNYADISTLCCRLHCISSKCRQRSSNILLKGRQYMLPVQDNNTYSTQTGGLNAKLLLVGHHRKLHVLRSEMDSTTHSMDRCSWHLRRLNHDWKSMNTLNYSCKKMLNWI